nr:GDSL-type esterase/lipase family protein [Microbacterium barkeri]
MPIAASASPATADSDRRRLAAALTDPAPLNWIITGDSITHGLVHTQGGRSYPEHLHELIRGELERVRDIVLNTAISGNRIVDLLDDWDRRVASWRPDVVTLMIGTNDASDGGPRPVISADDYAASLRDFVTRVRGLGAIPVLQTPPASSPVAVPTKSTRGRRPPGRRRRGRHPRRPARPLRGARRRGCAVGADERPLPPRRRRPRRPGTGAGARPRHPSGGPARPHPRPPGGHRGHGAHEHVRRSPLTPTG